jgi:nucleoside-diphosphate-sugar epimerase
VSDRSTKTFLVTGALGCLGAWVMHHLLERGDRVVAFDLSDNRHRLDLLMDAEKQERIRFVRGDLTDYPALLDTMEREGIERVIHLAALQVPFCKADPILGARVNVVGTVNMFEAARQLGLEHLSYASSLAVYGPRERYDPGPDGLVADGAPFDPRTLYGVYKQANEGTAAIYWQDHGISSTTLRPYTVYGVGRDQGLTSEPTVALLAAAADAPYRIGFGGSMQFHLASDVALQFIEAAEPSGAGATGYNLGTPAVSVADFVAHIAAVRPDADISHGDMLLPFPDGIAAGEYGSLSRIPVTPLAEGIRQTIDHFASALDRGLIRFDPPAA